MERIRLLEQQLAGLLGTFAFTPGTTHKVSLSDEANGYLVADAIRLVSVSLTPQPGLYFIHTDHLNTPRLIADATQTTVWTWEQGEPFGASTANEDPDNDGVAFEFNLRFPGQYFDKETNLAYNMARDYDPGIGRYIESDPIGLDGGLNTYAYVGGSPIVWTDALGLRIEWGNWVLNNALVRSNLVALNAAIVGAGSPDECFVIRVTGGDRYRDSGNPRIIRSATNNSVVAGASQTSPHLIERGARAADFNIENSSDPSCSCKPVTNRVVDEALRETDFAPGNTSRDYPQAPHTHVALPPLPRFMYRP